MCVCVEEQNKKDTVWNNEVEEDRRKDCMFIFILLFLVVLHHYIFIDNQKGLFTLVVTKANLSRLTS